MRILAISPHVDDTDLMCGGSISRWEREGHLLTILYLIDAQDQNKGFNMRQEALLASSVLNVEKVYFGNFKNRTLHEQRQEVLDWLVSFKDRWAPNLVLCPSERDLHQDHKVVAKEAQRAFKYTNILSYQQPWNCLTVHRNYFITFEEEDMERKVEVLRKYQSQQFKPYFQEEYIRSLAITQAILTGGKYAESYEVIRWFC